MRDCSVDFAFFKKSMAKTVAGNEVIGPYCHRPLVMNDRFVDSFLLNKSVAESHLGIWIIWLARYGSVAISDCLVHLAFLEKHNAQVIVSHPAIGISGQRRPPERFDVAIHGGLSPRQRRQDCDHTEHRA